MSESGLDAALICPSIHHVIDMRIYYGWMMLSVSVSQLSALYLLKGHANIVDVVGYTFRPMIVVLELGSIGNLFYCLQDEEWQLKTSLKQR